MYQSKFAETQTIAVMSRLKTKGIWLDEAHAEMNSVISLLEQTYLKSFKDDEKYQHLLLKTMETTGRAKTVATYMIPKLDKGNMPMLDKNGQIVMETINYKMPIKDNGEWEVQSVRGDLVVRYTLTEKKKNEVVALLTKEHGKNGAVRAY